MDAAAMAVASRMRTREAMERPLLDGRELVGWLVRLALDWIRAVGMGGDARADFPHD